MAPPAAACFGPDGPASHLPGRHFSDSDSFRLINNLLVTAHWDGRSPQRRNRIFRSSRWRFRFFRVWYGAVSKSDITPCSGNRANSIYNRIFARSRTPKCAKLVLGASAVHVRSRLCSRFFGVGIQKNEKRAILCVKGAYCELVSSSSSLDTASQREPAIRRVFLRARQ